MKEKIQKIIRKSLEKAKKEEKWPDFEAPEFEVFVPKEEKFGDFSSNVAMVLAKSLKKSPLEIAGKIAKTLNVQKNKDFEKIETAAPGYVNFYLSAEYFQNLVAEINRKKEKFGSGQAEKKKKIHLDFVSANPTGPIHIGNARGGPLGDALASVLEKAGHRVFREYYVNDFGNQVKVLGHSVLKDEEAQYRGKYIDDLHARIKNQDPFKAGQEAAKIILEEIIRPSMEKAGVYFDEYFSEKSLHDERKVEKVFKVLKDKSLLYEKDGALWFRAEKFGDEKDRVVKKNTGEITYFGGDIAYHKDKFDRGNDLAIDIWGADHHGDVKRILGAMEALGYGGKTRIVLTQMLKVIQGGEEIKMSKRKGTYVALDDLLEEAGRDAVRFFFLSHSADTQMIFDLDLAREKSEKNPVYYVQYAHTRIAGILRKIKNENKKEKSDLGLLTHEKELNLMRELSRFPELVEEISRNYEVHKLPHYAIKLADKFHSFYNDCRVIDEKNPKLTRARLELVKAVKIVLGETLRLMGVSAPESM